MYSGAKNFQQKKSNPAQKFFLQNLDFERGRISLIKISPRFQNQYHTPALWSVGNLYLSLKKEPQIFFPVGHLLNKADTKKHIWYLMQ